MSGTELARKILRNLTLAGQGNPKVRKEYADQLTNKSLSFLKNYESGFFGLLGEHDIIRDATLRMVDRVYELIQPYVVHFNKALGSSQLCIASTPPDEILETTEGEWPFHPPKDVSFYRARFSTHNLSLVIRGSEDRVDFFVLPAEQALRLSKVEDDYGALMTYVARMENGTVVWEVEEKQLTDERFERYCLLLLDYFIKQTHEELVRAS